MPKMIFLLKLGWLLSKLGNVGTGNYVDWGVNMILNVGHFAIEKNVAHVRISI